VRFAATADAYDRFMGRYSVHLAPSFVDFAHVSPGQRVLDVGCGPGALTTELVKRLGTSSVAAVDPAEQFAAATRERHPGVEVHVAAAESLPCSDGEFDAALAQLVVHFMEHPVGGLAERARVTCDGGRVAACVWDHAGGNAPLSPFWRAVAYCLHPRVIALSFVQKPGDMILVPRNRISKIERYVRLASLAAFLNPLIR